MVQRVEFGRGGLIGVFARWVDVVDQKSAEGRCVCVCEPRF